MKIFTISRISLIVKKLRMTEPPLRNWSGPVRGTDFRSGPSIPGKNATCTIKNLAVVDFEILNPSYLNLKFHFSETFVKLQ